MGSSSGYLLGKVQLVGAIRSEVLTSLVSTLLQRYQVSETGRKQLKFHDGIKYMVDCSDRGLKLTAPGFRSRDEGFESDSESLRSLKQETAELDLIELLEGLDLSKGNTQLSSLSSIVTTDNTSITSTSNIPAFSDDSNSSSGNGSDSDEFSPVTSGERSLPSWEPLPNLSSFQSYPIQDVLFCHADTLHPATLVWVVRHQSKMVALITYFKSRSEAEELFQKYREVRLKVKPLKQKNQSSATVGKMVVMTPAAPPPPPPRTCSVLSSTLNREDQRYLSLPSIQPTEVIPETNSKSQVFSIMDSSKTGSLNFNEIPFSSMGTIPRNFNTMSFQRQYFASPDVREEAVTQIELESESEEDSDEEPDLRRYRSPTRPQRKVQVGSKIKPVMLVPLKNESVTTPKSSYPKESYLYHVMGRNSSTFAPYQRSLNFVPSPHPVGSGGMEYFTWAGSNGRQHLVPFSAWAEISELRSSSKGQGVVPFNSSGHRPVPITPKSMRRGISKTSTLSHSTGKGTARILLRDAGSYPPGVWANLSQRVKQNLRENLIPKLNSMWMQPGDASGNKVKKKPSKKVTFNAWATVQIV